MHIQCFGGGLANQIRHYIFYRYGERRFPQHEWVLDDIEFFMKSVAHNGYELERVFGIKPNLLSRCLKKEQLEKVVSLRERGVFLPEILQKAGIPFVMVSDTLYNGFFSAKTMIQDLRSDDMWNLPYNNVYYFHSGEEDYCFRQDLKENLRELTFPPLLDSQNLKYADCILGNMSVAVHIRRNTYVDHHWDAAPSEYRKACKNVLKQFPDAWFFVFSDDLEWCRSHADEMGLNLADKIVYVEGNVCGKNYIDMQLMSMCRGIIRTGMSSFSQVAAWLNQNLEFEIKVGRLMWCDMVTESQRWWL